MNTPPSQTKYQCLHCSKKYIRISSMEKHKLLCDLEHSSAYQNKIKSQEEDDMPSYRQLVELVKILHLKRHAILCMILYCHVAMLLCEV